MDLNNDSLLDLVSGDRSGYVNYFRRLPSRQLTTEPRLQANGATIYDPLNSAPHLVDWNEDGLLDLLLANSDQSPTRIRLYLNSGTPGEYLFTDYTELTAGGSPIGLSRMNPTVVDLNLDGAKDLVCGEDLGRIFYYENVGTNDDPVLAVGVMLEAEGVPIQWPSGYTDLKVWADDWNCDGTPDLVVGNYMDSLHLYLAYPLTGVTGPGSPEIRSELLARPNPFSGRVRFCLPVGSETPVEVLDASGRQVALLAATGSDADWDGSRLPAGIYFARSGSSTARLVRLE